MMLSLRDNTECTILTVWQWTDIRDTAAWHIWRAVKTNKLHSNDQH